MSSAAQPSNRYDAEFEARVERARRRSRALRAANIDDEVTKADFESACLAKLSQPATVTFEWPNPRRPGQHHCGWVMLCFDTRPNCKQALEELQGFKHEERKIKVKVADKIAKRPRSQRQDEDTAAPRFGESNLPPRPQVPLPPAPQTQAPQRQPPQPQAFQNLALRPLTQAQMQTQRLGQALGVAPDALAGIVSAVAPASSSAPAPAPALVKSEADDDQNGDEM